MFELIRANRRRAVILMVAMLALFAALGYGLGYAFMHSALAGLVIAVAVAGFLALLSWNAGDALILSSSQAHRIEQEDHPVLFNVVEEMRIAAGLPKTPEIYIIDAAAPNAFATGRDPEHAKIAVTAGLLERLDRDELQGVVGHEMGHVANRDILYMMMATVLLGAIVMLADMGFYAMLFGGGGRRRTSAGGGGQAQAIMMIVAIALVILAPLFAQLLYFALSRRREYLADACSARYTRYPEGLARALEKIAASSEPLPVANRATAALYIANPLKTSGQGLSDLTSTHPPISQRIRILRSMAGEMSYAAYDQAFRQVTGRAVGVVPFSGLHEQGAAPAPAPAPARAAPPPRPRRTRVRETTDALWSAQGYRFVRCPCGTTLKVPPGFPKDVVTCPNCGRDHRLDG